MRISDWTSDVCSSDLPGCRRNVVASLPSCSADMALQRISIFPLAGALLFPRMHLPLHIFEPRYRALISDSMARDRRIGMIQPRDRGLTPALYDVGCLGRIADVEALEDGRDNIVLEGIARFRVQRASIGSASCRERVCQYV